MTRKPKISVKPDSPIKATSIADANTQLVLSYQYLCLNSKKYSMDEISDNRTRIGFYKDYFDKMTEYCSHENFKKYIRENGRYRDRNHIHPIDWRDSRIKESCFTSLNEDLMKQIQNDCWQLGINNQTFRIHGFFIENVFYVVWIDPLHNLYAFK